MKYKKSHYYLPLLFVLILSVLVPLMLPQTVYAEDCEYELQELTQGIVDDLEDNLTLAEQELAFLNDHVGDDWLFLTCFGREEEATVLYRGWSDDSELLFNQWSASASGLNYLVEVGSLDVEQTNGTSIGNVSVAEGFLASLDVTGDEAPDITDPAIDPPPAAPGEKDCREEFPGAIAWAVCAGIEWVDDGIDSLINTLNSLLSVGPGEVNTAEMKKAWSYFRNMASLFLVIIGLVMIIGQAVGKE